MNVRVNIEKYAINRKCNCKICLDFYGNQISTSFFNMTPGTNSILKRNQLIENISIRKYNINQIIYQLSKADAKS